MVEEYDLGESGGSTVVESMGDLGLSRSRLAMVSATHTGEVERVMRSMNIGNGTLEREGLARSDDERDRRRGLNRPVTIFCCHMYRAFR